MVSLVPPSIRVWEEKERVLVEARLACTNPKRFCSGYAEVPWECVSHSGSLMLKPLAGKTTVFECLTCKLPVKITLDAKRFILKLLQKELEDKGLEPRRG